MKSKNAAIGFIFVTLFIDSIGWGLIIPVMPNLISELKHIPVNEASAEGGLLLFVYAYFLGGRGEKVGWCC